MTDRPQIRCEWGRHGLAAHAPDSDVVIIVDVLSFSTCVDIVVSHGATIFPIPWKDARASEFAAEMGAELAGSRGKPGFSLSPASFLVVPAGEQWPDGTLRPCLEDWLGSGAILDALSGEFSSEAEAARESFRSARADLPRLLPGCTSGRELVDLGYSEDVRLAAELNCSDTAPVLRGGAYSSMPRPGEANHSKQDSP